MKTIVIGDRGVGKTTLIRRLCGAEGVRTSCGRAEVTPMSVNDGATVQFWEMCIDASAELQSDAELALLVYDVTNLRSFEQVTKHAAEPTEKVRSRLLVGLKSDQAVNRAVTVAQAHTWAVGSRVRLVEVSAASGLNLDQLHRLVMLARAAPEVTLKQPQKPQIPMFMQSMAQVQLASQQDRAAAQVDSILDESFSSFHSTSNGNHAGQPFAVVDDNATMKYLDSLCRKGDSQSVRVETRLSPREKHTTVYRAVHQQPWDASTRLGDSEHTWQHKSIPNRPIHPIASPRPRTARTPRAAEDFEEQHVARQGGSYSSRVLESTISSRHKVSPRPAREVHTMTPTASSGNNALNSPNKLNAPEHPTVLDSLQGLIGMESAASTPGPLILRIELDIGHGRKEKIDVRKGDKPAVLAEAFVQLHSLQPAIIPRLASLIDQRISGVLQADGGTPIKEQTRSRTTPRSTPRSTQSAARSTPHQSRPRSSPRRTPRTPGTTPSKGFHLETSARAEGSRRCAPALLKLHIQISHGRSGTIIVRKGDDTYQLASAFVDTFKLNSSMVDTIHNKILEQLKLVQPKVSLPKLDLSQLAPKPPATPGPGTPKTVRETLFNLDVDLGPQGAGRLVVRRGDDPDTIAQGFVQQHNLRPEVRGKLVQLIHDQLNSMAVSTPR